MSSFETFHERVGLEGLRAPLDQDAPQAVVDGLEPGDLGMSEELAAGLGDAVRDALARPASDAASDPVGVDPAAAVEPGSAADEAPAVEPRGESSGGGAW